MFSKNRIRVLLADDVETDRKIERAVLKSIGITDIDEAENGAIAKFKIENSKKIGNPYNLIITDWNMPKLSGLDLIKELKLDKQMKNVPLILLTGVSDEDKVRLALTSGVSDYIIKPVDREVLLAKLTKFIRPNT